MKRSTLPLLLSLLPLSVLATLPLVATAQTAAAPTLLSFQGRLTNPSGNPVADGNYQITFSLWSALTGGTKRWEQVSSSVTVRSGTFAVLLNVGTGFQNGTNAANLFDPTMWLEIKVGSDAALTPRQQLTSTAYALKANTVPDGSLTAAKFLGGVVQPGGAAGGDLIGTYPNPQIKTDASLLYKVSGTIMNASGSGVSVNVQQTTANNEVNDSAWQSFTPTANGQINGLDIYVGTTMGLSKTIPVVLYAGEGTTGTELLRRTVTFVPTLGFQYVDFTAPVTVTGGQKYTWFIGTSSSLKFGYATGNPYADGRADVGASLDYAFRVYMTTGNSAIINVNGNLNATGNMTLGSAVANRAGLQIGGTANRYVNIGQSSTNNLLMGWIYNATAANAYGLLETFGGSNPLALQTSGGNVGIGLTNPGTRLEVRATGAGDTIRVSGTGSNAPGYGIYNGTTQTSSLGLALANAQWSGSAVVGDTVLRTVSGRLLFDNTNAGGVPGITMVNNNVGLGTTAPNARLDVNGDVDVRGAGTLEFGAGIVGKEASAGKIGYGAFTTGTLDIVGAGNTVAERKIKLWNEGGATFAGNVGIKTASGVSPLTVRGETQSAFGPIVPPALSVTNGNVNVGISFIDAIASDVALFGTTTDHNMVLTAGQFFNFNLWLTTDGRVGVNGSPIPNYKLYSNGQAGGTTAWIQSSDARYKQNIASLDNALESILNLRGVTYDWRRSDFPGKDFEEGRQIGFIAQEVEKVLPELVKTGGDGYKAVAYSNLVPVLVEAVKTLNAKVETLKKAETENAELKARLAAIEAAIAELKAQHK